MARSSAASSALARISVMAASNVSPLPPGGDGTRQRVDARVERRRPAVRRAQIDAQARRPQAQRVRVERQPPFAEFARGRVEIALEAAREFLAFRRAQPAGVDRARRAAR